MRHTTGVRGCYFLTSVYVKLYYTRFIQILIIFILINPKQNPDVSVYLYFRLSLSILLYLGLSKTILGCQDQVSSIHYQVSSIMYELSSINYQVSIINKYGFLRSNYQVSSFINFHKTKAQKGGHTHNAAQQTHTSIWTHLQSL